MQLTARHHFDAPPARVYAMLTSEEFLTDSCARMGTRAHRVEVVAGAEEAALTRTTATIEAPGTVRRFIGESLTVAQEMDWGPAGPDGRRDAAFTIRVPGMPVNLEGTAELAPEPDGTAVTYTGDLTVGIPVVAGLIEQQAAPEILAVLAAQERHGAGWLAAHP